MTTDAFEKIALASSMGFFHQDAGTNLGALIDNDT